VEVSWLGIVLYLVALGFVWLYVAFIQLPRRLWTVAYPAACGLWTVASRWGRGVGSATFLFTLMPTYAASRGWALRLKAYRSERGAL
jgi:hypothetical protein